MSEKTKAILFVIIYSMTVVYIRVHPVIMHKIKVRRRKRRIDNIRKKKKL